MKKYKILAVGALVAIVYAVAVTRNPQSPEKPRFLPPERILNLLNTNQISGYFSPVAIYLYKSGHPKFAGLGTYFHLNSGGERVLTAAHLLKERDGVSTFAVQLLKPLDAKMETVRGISKILPSPIPVNLPGHQSADYLLCEVGKPQPLGRVPKATKPPAMVAEIKFFAKEKQTAIKSLLSGEEVWIIGDAGVFSDEIMFAAAYQPFAGQSGEGFVDAQNRLYIMVSSTRTPAFRENSKEGDEFEMLTGVSRSMRLSLFVGPFRPM